jgi:hypothetical protein
MSNSELMELMGTAVSVEVTGAKADVSADMAEK